MYTADILAGSRHKSLSKSKYFCHYSSVVHSPVWSLNSRPTQIPCYIGLRSFTPMHKNSLTDSGMMQQSSFRNCAVIISCV